MKTKLTTLIVLVLLSSALSSQLTIKNVQIDSVWLSDSLLPNSTTIVRKSLDCTISFFPEGTGSSLFKVEMSLDSGKTFNNDSKFFIWYSGIFATPDFFPLHQLNVTQKVKLRILGENKRGVVFRVKCRQTTPQIANFTPIQKITALPNTKIQYPFNIEVPIVPGNASFEKIFIDTNNDGTADDSSSSTNLILKITTPSCASSCDCVTKVALWLRDINNLQSEKKFLTLQFYDSGCDLEEGRFTLGAQENAIYGASIELDSAKVKLAAEAKLGTSGVDLVYGFSLSQNLPILMNPSYAKNTSGFVNWNNWIYPNTTRFYKMNLNLPFDSIISSSQLKDLFNPSYSLSNERTAIQKGDMIIVETDQNAIAVLYVEDIEGNASGTATFRYKKTKSVPSQQPISQSGVLRILTPNGGEIYHVGDTVEIKFEVLDFSKLESYDVIFRLYTGNEFTDQISETTMRINESNTLAFKWIVPQILPHSDWVLQTGSNYKIAVMDYVASSNNDFSDKPFTIIAE